MKNSENRGRLLRFSRYVLPFKTTLGLLFSSVIVTILINLTTPWCEKIMIDEAIPNKDTNLLSRITNDVGYVQNLLNDQLFEIIGSAIRVFVVIFFLFAISTKLTLLCICILPIIVAVFFIFKQRAYIQNRRIQETQEIFLLGTTIFNNIALEKDTSEKTVLDPLELARAAEFISDLENPLEAPVEPGGTNFSGGQRQRLSLGRALSKEAELSRRQGLFATM